MDQRPPDDTSQFWNDPSYWLWVTQPNPTRDAFWQGWLAQHPHLVRAEAKARQRILALQHEELTPIERQHVWQRIKRGLRQRAAYQQQRTRWLVAASLAICCAISLWLAWPSSTQYQTAFGQQQTVQLPDGSTVTLNGNSTLRLHGDWSTAANRELHLYGEGYFTVQRRLRSDGQFQPMIVHTTNGDVRVLGTRFNVVSRHQATEVVLESGVVEYVQAPSAAPIKLQPGQQLRSAPSQTIPKPVPVRPANARSWLQQQWVMNEMPLSTALQRVEDTYGLHVVLVNATDANRLLSGTLQAESGPKLLENIAAALQLHVQRRADGSYILTPMP